MPRPASQHPPNLLALTAGTPARTVTRRLSVATANPVAVRAGLYDGPGEYAQRFDGDDRAGAHHNHPVSAVYVGDRQAGVYIHGWPPCHLKRCVVVLREWDDLIRAVASEAELSFAILL